MAMTTNDKRKSSPNPNRSFYGSGSTDLFVYMV